MSARNWGTSKDAQIEYLSLTAGKLEGALEVLRKSFFVYENVCTAVRLSKDPEATAEFEDFFVSIAKEGLSLIAVEKGAQKVVGVAFNKLGVNTAENNLSYYEQYGINYKRPSSKAIMKVLDNVSQAVNLFDVCKTDCILEVVGLSVLRENSSQGIAIRLSELSIELGRLLLSGNNVKVPLNGVPLPLGPTPTAVCTVTTTNVTRHISEKIGGMKAAEIKYEDLMFEGKSFASRIGPETSAIVILYKIL